MSEDYTVGQYLVDRLAGLGLKHLFSIAGDYSLEWVNNYVAPKESGIEVIEEVNELNAGYAADGYARLKGIGALCVTYSVGSLSAVNAIAGAYVERVPVVLINGTPGISRTIRFEQTGFSSHHFISGRETDLQVFEHITAATARIDNPDLAPMLIDYALTKCITERRPVYIELLEDMVDQRCKPPPLPARLEPARAMSNKVALEESIEIIQEELERATNPLLWVGVEVGRFGLRDEAAALIRKLNIPYTTDLLSKAVLSEDDPMFVGVFDGRASSAAVQDLAKTSDFILALGVWLTDITSLGWRIDFHKTAFVSLDAVKYDTYFGAQVSLRHLLDGLLKANLRPREAPALPREQSREACGAASEDEITYPGFYNFIAKYIDNKTIIGSDVSLNYFGSLQLKVGAAGGYIAQPSYSSIGYIGPAATGICLAKKDDQKVMVFSGDAGFQMSAQCLSTQTRFELNPIVFVIDNGVYGVEQWLANASVFSNAKPSFSKSCILHPWDYSKLSEVFGCQGWKVGTYRELAAAIEGAKNNLKSPSIIQVVVPRGSIPNNAAWKVKLDK